MPKKITVQRLRDKGACSAAIARFEEIFGQEAEVTPENAEKAQLNGGDWVGYAIDYFLEEEDAAKVSKVYRGEGHGSNYASCPQCREAWLKFVEVYNGNGT